MSAERLLNAMRGQAMSAAGTRADSRQGLVTSYDPNRYAVKVQIMPEGAETGWLPLASPWVGNLWGVFAPPSIGDMIEVHFQEGSPEAGYACLRFYNDSDRPLACPSGEFWIVHQSGSFLEFKNDGSVLLHAAGDLKATVGGNAEVTVAGNITSSATQWTHAGPMTVNGLITGTQGLNITGAGTLGHAAQIVGTLTTTGDVVANNISLDGHHHPGVQTGSGNTGGPV